MFDKKETTMNKVKTVLILLAMALGLVGFVLAVPACTGCNRGYSDGDRTGVVLKLSHKGVAFKSWEGVLDVGGFHEEKNENGPPSMVRNLWLFSVTDSAIVPQIQEAMKTGQRVTLHYTQWLIGPTRIDTDSEIVGVSFVRRDGGK
jgi:hypothetical protein